MHEAMRDLDEGDVARQASRNSSIVREDTAKNYTLVNDGDGGFRVAQDVDEVLDYGDDRMSQVYRKLSEKSFESTTIVAWAPKSILREVPDFYPVFNDEGKEVGRRSRWVIDDPAEFARWRDETVGYLSDDVLPGGHDAVHAVVVNLDESVPHIHVPCDPFAPDPKHEGKLRTEAQQAWGQHRDVTEERTNADGKVRKVQITGATKMRRYQEGYREHLLSRGIQIERDVNPEGTSLDKKAFRTLESRKVAVDAQAVEVANKAVMLEEAHDINRDEAAVVRGKLVKQSAAIKAERAEWNETERPALVAAARAEGHAEGVAAGMEEVQQLRDTAAVDAAAAARERQAARQARERIEEREREAAEQLGQRVNVAAEAAERSIRAKAKEAIDTMPKLDVSGDNAPDLYVRIAKKLPYRGGKSAHDLVMDRLPAAAETLARRSGKSIEAHMTRTVGEVRDAHQSTLRSARDGMIEAGRQSRAASRGDDRGMSM